MLAAHHEAYVRDRLEARLAEAGLTELKVIDITAVGAGTVRAICAEQDGRELFTVEFDLATGAIDNFHSTF